MFKRIHPTLLAALFVSFMVAQVFGIEEMDVQYIKVSSTIDQADSLDAKGEPEQAKAKYVEAQKALLKLQSTDKTWNTKMVSYRLNYLAGKIATLSKLAPAAAASENSSSQPENRSTVKAAALPQGVTMRLIDAGAEPRKVLRLKAKVGDKQMLSVKTDSYMELNLGNSEKQAMQEPTEAIKSEFVVEDVANNGDITYKFVVSDASMADKLGDASKSFSDAIKGVSVTRKISGRGIAYENGQRKIPSSLNQTQRVVDKIIKTLSDAVIPLPEEPVGIGAKWEEKKPHSVDWVTYNETTVFELVSIESDGRLNLKVTANQSAINQKIDSPLMPGMKGDLTKLAGDSHGNALLDLNHLLPIKAQLDNHANISMIMNMGNQKQAMTVKMNIKIALEGKSAN